MNVRDFLLTLQDHMEHCIGVEMGGIFVNTCDFKFNINNIPTVRVHFINDTDNGQIDFRFISIDKNTKEEFTFLTIQSSEINHDAWIYAIMKPSKEPIWKLDILELDTEMKDSNLMSNLLLINSTYAVLITNIISILENWRIKNDCKYINT